MTKYLQTKRNSIEEAISSVVLGEKITKKELDRLEDQNEHGLLALKLAQAYGTPAEVKTIKDINKRHEQRGSISQADSKERNAIAAKYYRKVKESIDENGFVVGKVKMPKMKGGAKLQSKTNFDFRLFDPEDSPGSDKANDEMNREIVKASKMKDKATAMAHMNKIQRKHSKHGATDTEPREVISQVLNRVFGESVELGEAKYEVQYTVSSRVGDSRSRTKSRLSKIDIDARSKQDAEDKFFKQAEKSPMMRDAMRRDMLDVVYVGLKESLDEGYESEVLKVLKDADIDGYFKMGKLYVSRRDAKDAKKALEDSDEITKLPKMVMEDERMKKLTPRQRQALARVQAKPKSQVSLPKMPDFMKPKKEENEMDIVDTIRNIVEKKLDPVNPKAVKKKFDDRKDKDIDNDGDVDSTDTVSYTHLTLPTKRIV